MTHRNCGVARVQTPGALVFLVASGFLLLATLSAFSQTLPEAPGKLPVTSFQLNNGMDVVVIEDRRAPVVTHMVWYRAGAADEDRGKSGIAHFLEHLLFKGTKAAPDGEFSKAVALNGGQENAFTSADTTAYFQRIAKDRLEMVMTYEADRMVNLQLSQKDIETERNVVLEERASRTGSNPSAILGEQMSAAMYLVHPYGDPVVGWENEVKALTRDDALAFYRRYYTPSNAILVVAGDVSPQEVRDLAERTYGKIPRRADAVKRARVREPRPTAARRVIVEDPRVATPRWRRSYLTPSSANAADSESEGLEILAQILGGDSGSRLYRVLVIEKKLAIDAGAYFQGSRLDYGEIGVYAQPVPGVSLKQIETAVESLIEEVRRGQVSAEELSRAKFQMIAQSVYARDSQYRMTRAFGNTLVTGGTIEDVLDWPRRIEKTTAAQIRAAAEKYLTTKRSVTGILRRPQNAGERS